MRKALVTGAAGFIGSNLVRVLLEEGVDVRAMVLPGEDDRNLVGLDVEKVEGNVLDVASLDRALEGCDTLFHLAAIYSHWEQDRRVFYKVNLQGSRNTLWAARRAEIEKIVYTSSIGGLGIAPGFEAATEETEFNQIDFANDYVLTKYLSQEEALSFAREGFPLVVVNPAGPFGEGDKQPTPTGKMIVDVVNGTNKMYYQGGFCVVDVKDVARGHVLAARKGRIGEMYILGSQNFTMKEFFNKVAGIAGVPAPSIRIPHAVAVGAGKLSERISRLTGKPPLATSREVPYIAQHAFYDGTKAREELGLELTPVDDSLRRAIEWFRKEGYITGEKGQFAGGASSRTVGETGGSIVIPSRQGTELNGMSLGAIIGRFAELPVPDPHDWVGSYRGEIVGPAFVRLSAGPSNLMNGIVGWLGKEIGSDLSGLNLVRRGGRVVAVVPFKVETRTSLADGKGVPAIVYSPENRFPVNRVIDEFRILDDNCLLCLTHYELPLMRSRQFPFLLHKGPVNP